MIAFFKGASGTVSIRVRRRPLTESTRPSRSYLRVSPRPEKGLEHRILGAKGTPGGFRLPPGRSGLVNYPFLANYSAFQITHIPLFAHVSKLPRFVPTGQFALSEVEVTSASNVKGFLLVPPSDNINLLFGLKAFQTSPLDSSPSALPSRVALDSDLPLPIFNSVNAANSSMVWM